MASNYNGAIQCLLNVTTMQCTRVRE